MRQSHARTTHLTLAFLTLPRPFFDLTLSLCRVLLLVSHRSQRLVVHNHFRARDLRASHSHFVTIPILHSRVAATPSASLHMSLALKQRT